MGSQEENPMEIEIAKHQRKCKDCEGTIERGEMASVFLHDSPFGTLKCSYCKTCTIKGLLIKRKNIGLLLKRIGGM